MASLALDRAPATAHPLRFLRLVPVWGVAAALLLAYHGPVVWESRWAPDTIALVHAFTLGVLGNAMLGSLLQFLPVVAGVQPRATSRLSGVLATLFNAGVAGLVCGLSRWPALVPAAGALLAITVAVFAVLTLACFRFDGRQTLLRSGLALAVSGLLVTALLGLVLAMAWVGLLVVPMALLTDIHAALGLLGGVLMLVGVVGSVVVPMFQGTVSVPPRWLAGWIALLATALALSIFLRLSKAIGANGMAMILAVPVAVMAVTLLVLQWRARHRRKRALTKFWRMGALALTAACLVALIAVPVPFARSTLIAGVLVIGIGLPALVVGMLLEITTFLAWLELQQRRSRGTRVPGVDSLLPEQGRSLLWALHTLAALAVLAAAAWPHAATTYLAALALAIAYGWTFRTLLGVRQLTRHIAQGLQTPAEKPT